MHSLKVVHCDLKTSNIAWSSIYDKWVFIDFGFSKMLEEKPGKKTLTKFIGTYQFASK
jgi:serine/threonine protein kinase